jgi:hypothetical protein
MSPDTPQAADIKAAIDDLIQSASRSDFAILDRIYHDDMKIFMVGGDAEVNQFDKAAFTKHLVDIAGSGEAPSTWAKYHSVEADDRNGHVMISRKVNLTGAEQIITLSIDLIHQNDRWQITREVILAGA